MSIKVDKKLKIGLAGLLAVVILVGGGYLVNNSVKNNFAESLKDAAEAASENTVTLTGYSLNIFTGNGSIEMVSLNDTVDTDKNLFEIQDVEFSFAVTSVLFGPLHVEEITVAPAGVIGNIIGSGARVKTLVETVRGKLVAGMQPDEESQIIVDKLSFGKGVMKIGPALIGSTLEKEIDFPATTLTKLGDDTPLTKERLAERIIFAVGQNALNATAYRVPIL